MAGEYPINLSNGSILATLYPLETNGPGGTSTPRKIQEARPRYIIGNVSTGSNTFTIDGVDLTDVFRPGFVFEVVNSTGNDGSYAVISSVFSLGNTVVTVASVVDATVDGDILAHIFRLSGDLTYRFGGSPVLLSEFTVSGSAQQAGSPLAPSIDGTYTLQPIGTVYHAASDTTIIPVTNGSIRDNLYLPSIYVPYGNITYRITDQNTSLKLPGKGTTPYGEVIIEDLVRMVEHFAHTEPPNLNVNLGGSPASADPIIGQLWYNTTSGAEGFNVWNGSAWMPINESLISGFLVFSDVENTAGSPVATPKVYISGSESTLPAPWVGGSPNNLSGLVVWTDTNPTTGEPIFRVVSKEGLEALRVEYNGYVRTVNAIDIQSTDPSYVAGDLNLASNLIVGSGGSPYVVETNIANRWVGINTNFATATDPVNDAMEVTGNLRANSQFFGSNQSEAAPTFSFTNHPDTGMFTGGSPSLGFAIGGVEKLRVKADGTIHVPTGYEALVTDDTMLVNKAYADSTGGGSASWREPVVVRDDTLYASNAAFPTDGVIDGVTLIDQDRVLFTNVTVSADEDIWLFNAVGSPALNSWTQDVGRTVSDVVSVNDGSYAGLAYIYTVYGLWDDFGSGAGINVRHEAIVSTGQTVFNLSEPYSPGTNRLFVFVDGVKQIRDNVGSPAITDYTETDHTTVTFDTTVPPGSVVEFFMYDELTSRAVAKRETQTGLTGTPVITFTSITYAVGGDNLLVFMNGQKMVKGTDYTETTSNSITWVNPTLTGTDVLEFYSTVPIVTGTKMQDIDNVDPATPSNGDTLVYNSGTGLYESTPLPAGKPGYVEYPNETWGGSPNVLTFATPGVGGSNVNGGTATLQVFVNGVYQLEGKNYTAGSSNITLIGSPPAPASFDLIIYEFG